MAHSPEALRQDREKDLSHLGSLEIVYRSIDSLTPYAHNARTHNRRQIRQVAASIRKFGWTNPVIIDRHGGIIAGHARIEAAKLLGLDEVPTICIEHMTEADKRAYIIADNRLAELADWDFQILGAEFEVLIDLDVDVELTGFEMGQVDLILLGREEVPEVDPADRVPRTDPATPAVTKPGDVWLMNGHRLYCGNALETASYTALMGSKRARMVFSDPPYNVPIDGHVSGLGATKHREFAMASGEMTEAQFVAFLDTVFGLMAVYSVDGSLHYICMDWRHLFELLAAGRSAYTELKNLCVWTKTNAGMGSFYRSQHELVAVFKHGSAASLNNIELGRHGRNRTNVWEYAGANTFREGRMEDLAAHPTVKPVQLVADAILDCTRRKDIVLDPFVGSGTTILAAERTGRHCYAMEIDPAYCDTAVRRWQAFTGGDAILEATGQTFTEAAETRRPEKENPYSSQAETQHDDA